MDLDQIRAQIDELDRRIVGELNKRLALAAEIGKLKRSQGGSIYVAEREEAVLRKVIGQNEGPI
ncbi:MAG TPA: chorismate mutase, partial [Opitutus sp.]|nr:chorismate mutase [Opitutus sp.]